MIQFTTHKVKIQFFEYDFQFTKIQKKHLQILIVNIFLIRKQ